MEKEVRNRIQRATQDARALVERELAEQLGGIFDIRLDGNITAEPGVHLDAEQRVLRTKLVAAVEHQIAAGLKPADAVASYLREAAFTMLNRFVALKMLEARGLVQECVSRGDGSAGFKEFTGLAPGLVQVPDHGYRLYIESLFDEIGREVRVLFDRRDSAGLLWPRRQALVDLLTIFNAAELVEVWKQDETIGWVYQYFNSKEERETMRDPKRGGSQAPRSSRELAVRNQFFTPRYVVEFLTDNTLGRIWYEIQHGKTHLLEQCQYLVRRPSVIFLAEGHNVPKEDPLVDEQLSQEELLRKTTFIPFRAKKDPRDLKILDPACGSGHFLLYAFELLIVIYQEGWGDQEAPRSEITGRTLREDYPSLDELRRAIPGLVLRHNLYGTDIDPRAAQIAALALWMRAQRAHNDFGVSRGERPPVTKTNIVIAEPMPGEKELRREFIASLDKELGELVELVFEKMELAGEAGPLLKIEGEIRLAIRHAFGESGELFRKTDEDRWRDAESALLIALQRYAEQSQNGGIYRRRLFADDAIQGFAFIDLCRKRYDVVVMNPPFGEPTERSRIYLQERYAALYKNIFSCFFAAAGELLHEGGLCGAITSRTFLFLPDFAELRTTVFAAGRYLRECAELGAEVLDSATVRVAATLFGRDEAPSPLLFLRVVDPSPDDKPIVLRELLRSLKAGEIRRETYALAPAVFSVLPGNVFAYTTPSYLRKQFATHPPLQPNRAWVRRVPGTGGNESALRLSVEVPDSEKAPSGRWVPYAKGGGFSPFFGPPELVVWERHPEVIFSPARLAGCQIEGRPQSADLFGCPALTFSYANDFGLDVRPLPAGSLFDSGGPAIFPVAADDKLHLLGILNSRIVRRLLYVLTPERFKQVGLVQALPIPNGRSEAMAMAARAAASARRSIAVFDEMSCEFVAPFSSVARTLLATVEGTVAATLELEANVLEAIETLDAEANRLFALDSAAATAIREEVGDLPTEYPDSPVDAAPSDLAASLKLAGTEIGRGSLTCSFQNTGPLERLSHYVKRPPRRVLNSDATRVWLTEELAAAVSASILSWAVGVAIGRFDVRVLQASEALFPTGTLFDPAPASCAGLLQSQWAPEVPDGYPLRVPGAGILVADPGHVSDIATGLRDVFRYLWQRDDSALESALALAANGESLEQWVTHRFFDEHINRYSKSQRRAPIYWQLATPTTRYSVWLYYHQLTKDTLYKVVNDYVTPKVQHEERKLTALLQGAGGTPTASQRKEIEEQQSLIEELRAFRENVARIAPLWNPDLNDGVIINFAPLWRLVPHHRAWQKECRECWDKLVVGDYDWARLAMYLWPERVVPKCADDRSLAIAHGLEEVFWFEDADGKWQKRRFDQATVKRLVAERTSVAVKDALKSLIEMPAPRTGSVRRTAGLRQPATVRRAQHEVTISAPVDGAGADAVERVRETIAAAADGVSKADVLAATGITAAQWNAAINALVSQRLVTKAGERRGTRYHIVETKGTS